MGLKRKHFTFKYFFRQAKNALNTKLCNDKVEFNHKNVLFIEKLMLWKPQKHTQYALSWMFIYLISNRGGKELNEAKIKAKHVLLSKSILPYERKTILFCINEYFASASLSP